MDYVLYGNVGHKYLVKIKNTQRRRTWEMIVENSVDERLTLHRRTGTQVVIPAPNFAETKIYHEKIPNYCPLIIGLI